MTARLTDEHLDRLERALVAIENDYTPTCRTANYGNGCPGPTDESIEFWRRAADCVPAMLIELRTRRAVDLTDEERSAIGFARAVVAAHVYQDSVPAYSNSSGKALAVLDRLLGGKP